MLTAICADYVKCSAGWMRNTHMLIILLGSGRSWRWLWIISAKSTGRLRGIHSPGSKAAIIPRNQEFAASAVDPKKPASVKGSNHPKKSRICCLRHRPEESRLVRRQQSPQEIKNLLPPASTRRNVPWSKAAIIPRNQEFAATSVDPKHSEGIGVTKQHGLSGH